MDVVGVIISDIISVIIIITINIINSNITIIC